MNVTVVRNGVTIGVITAATGLAVWVTMKSGAVPEWYVALISAAIGYLYGAKSQELDGTRGIGSAIGNAIAKPVAKWIALALCAFVLGTGVSYINSQVGKKFEIAPGLTITIVPEITNWTNEKISNVVQRIQNEINKL